MHTGFNGPQSTASMTSRMINHRCAEACTPFVLNRKHCAYTEQYHFYTHTKSLLEPKCEPWVAIISVTAYCQRDSKSATTQSISSPTCGAMCPKNNDTACQH